MLSPVPESSPYALRTDKMRIRLVRWSRAKRHGPSRLRQPAVRRPLAAHRQSRGERLLS